MAIAGNLQVIVGLELCVPITHGGAMFHGVQHGHAVALDGGALLVADLQAAVVFYPLFHVPLSAQVNQFLAGTVFNV